MQYDILMASTKADLVAKVQKAINEGWEPLGGVAWSDSAQHPMQAMIRTEKSTRLQEIMKRPVEE